MKGGIKIILYKKFNYLAYWFRYQTTYLEMKYHLEQVLKGKYDTYCKNIYFLDRNIGKSAALARLSAKYNIPVVVSTQMWKKEIDIYIPRYLPKYFKKKRPTAIVANENFIGKRYEILLVEERLDDDCWERVLQATKHFIGYMNRLDI